MIRVVDKLIERIFKLEQKYRLFDIKLKDIQIYPFVRMSVYYELVKQLRIFSSDIETKSTFDKYKFVLTMLKNGIFLKEFISKRKRCDILAIESGRRDQKLQKNIYLGYLLDKLQHSYYVIRQSEGNGYYTKKEKTDNVTIFFEYYRLKSFIYRKFFMKKSLREEIILIADNLNEIFTNNIDYNIDLKCFLISMLEYVYSHIIIAKGIIKKIKPKLLVVQCAYERAPIVYAAKLYKIPVVELQHGTIYQYHIGYSYQHSAAGSIEMFPDYLFTFGDFWNTEASFPISKEHVISTGFPHFEHKIKNIKARIINKNQILFLSQNAIGKLLLKIAIEVAIKLPKHEVIFKLHPKQYAIRDKLLNNFSSDTLQNIIVYGAESPPLYDLFAQSAYQVGVFSTTLYEGIGCVGIPTIICKLPGWKFVKNLINSGYAMLAENSDQIVDIILRNNNHKDYDPAIFFRNNSTAKMCETIDSLLSRTA